MTGTEVCQPVVATDWFNIASPTLTAEVARRGQVNLKRFCACAIEVWYRCTGHLQIVTTKEKQKPIAEQANAI